MATNSDDIVARYRLDTDQLLSDVDALEKAYSKADAAGVKSSDGVNAAYKRQSETIAAMQSNIAKMQELRDKANDPAAVQRLNKAIELQAAALAKAKGVLAEIPPQYAKQVGILEVISNRIARLTQARQKAESPERIDRINRLIKDQEQRYNQLTGAIDKSAGATEKFNKSGEKVGGTAGLIGEKFKALGATIVSALATERVLSFIGTSVDEFAKAESAVEKLRFSVVSLGNESGQSVDLLNQQAAALAKFFSKGEIQNAQALLSQFGLTSDQIVELTPRVLDLAVALDTDLNSATQTAISALTGTSRGLKQINGEFADAGNPLDNYTQLIRVLANVEGAAEQAVNTTTGEIRRQKNELSDIEERVGERFAGAWLKVKAAALGFLDDVTRGVDDLGAMLESAFESMFGIELKIKKIRDQAIRGNIEAVNAFREANKNATDDELFAKLNQLNVLLETTKKNREELANSGRAYIQTALQQDDQYIARYANEIIAINDLIKARKSGKDQETQIIADISRLNADELRAYIAGLKERSDQRRLEVQKAIALAETQLKKVQELEQKAGDAAVQARKDALEQLRQLNDKYNSERLQAFAKTELDSLEISRQIEIERAKLQLTRAGGAIDKTGKAVGDLEAVRLFNQLVANINATFDERIAENKIKKNLEVQKTLRELNEQNLKSDLQATLETIDIATAAQIARIKLQYQQRADFSAKAELELQRRITEIQFNAERVKAAEQIRFINDSTERSVNQIELSAAQQIAIEIDAFNKRGDFSSAAKQRLEDRLTEIERDANRKRSEVQNTATIEKEKIERNLTNVTQQENDARVKYSEMSEAQQLAFRQQVFQESVNLVNAFFDLESAVFDARIQNLEAEKSKNAELFDAKQEALKADLDNRLITEAQYEIESEKIRKQRVESEKKIQQQVNAEKRKADLLNRARALFEIGINTASAIVRLGVEPGYPAAIPLVALVSALGAVQAGTVLATPLPKYEKGKKYVTRDKHEPMGIDTVLSMLNEGERVVTKKQNVKHWHIYEAIDNNRLDEYINQRYIAPALIKSRQQQETIRQEGFAQNIVNSLILNGPEKPNSASAQTLYDIARMFNNGIRINNFDQFVRLLSDSAQKSIYTS